MKYKNFDIKENDNINYARVYHIKVKIAVQQQMFLSFFLLAGKSKFVDDVITECRMLVD